MHLGLLRARFGRSFIKSPSLPALLIFDLDGTLIDSRSSILSCVRRALDEVGLKDLAFDERACLVQDLGRTIQSACAEAGREITPEVVIDFIEKYRFHHNRFEEGTIEVFGGVKEGLSELAKNFSLAVATTKHSLQAQLVLERLGIAKQFQCIQGTEPPLRYKPAPDILFEVFKKLSFSPADAAYIGDSPHDLLAAHTAGMQKIAASYGYGETGELMRFEPDYVLDEFSELISLPRLAAAI